jgi:hypothetical protein
MERVIIFRESGRTEEESFAAYVYKIFFLRD